MSMGTGLAGQASDADAAERAASACQPEKSRVTQQYASIPQVSALGTAGAAPTSLLGRLAGWACAESGGNEGSLKASPFVLRI